MKNWLVLFSFFFFSPFLIVSASLDHFQQIDDYFMLSRKFFPSDEGDKKEEQLVQYIQNFCLIHKLEYTKTKIEGDHFITNSFNVEIFLPGKNENAGTLVLFVPLNSIRHGEIQEDVSLSHLFALRLLKKALTEKLQKDLLVIFSGANGRENDEMYGIQQCLTEKKEKFHGAVVTLLDLISSNGNVFVSGSSTNKPIPAVLLKQVLLTIKNQSLFQFNPEEIKKARLNILKPSRSLAAFLAEDIPTIEFSNHTKKEEFVNGYYSTTYQNKLFSVFWEWIKNMDQLPINFEKDYNYQFIPFFIGNTLHHLLIPEVVQIILYFLILTFAVFLRKLIFYVKQKNDLHLICKNTPFFLFLFLFFYLISFIPFFLELFLSQLLNLSLRTQRSLFLYFLALFIFSFLLTSFLIDNGRKIKFRIIWQNAFYLYGAIYAAYVNLILVAFVDISLVYPYLFFLILLTLSHLTGRRFILKYFCYFLAMLPFLLTMFELTRSSSDIISSFMDNPLLAHLLFCSSSFPFLLLSLRIHKINKLKFGFINGKISVTGSVLAGSFCLFLLYTSILCSVKELPGDVTVNILNDYNQKICNIEMQENQNPHLKPIEIFDRKTGEHYQYNRAQALSLPLLEKNYQYNLSQKHNKYTIRLSTHGKIEKFNITLFCPKGMAPLSSNYPILQNTTIQSSQYDIYSLLVPRNTGKQLEIHLELSPNYQYTAVIEFYLTETTRRFSFLPLTNTYHVLEKNKESILLQPF